MKEERHEADSGEWKRSDVPIFERMYNDHEASERGESRDSGANQQDDGGGSSIRIAVYIASERAGVVRQAVRVAIDRSVFGVKLRNAVLHILALSVC